MRTFVRLRGLLASHKDLSRKLDELERRFDKQFQVVFEAIRQLMTPTDDGKPKRRIGFEMPATTPSAGRRPRARR